MPGKKKSFKPMEKQDPEGWFSDIRREDIGFKYTLNNIVMIIAKSAVMIETPAGVSVFSNTISSLESLLCPYWDKEYNELKKEIEEKTPKDFTKLVPNPDDRYKMDDFEKDGIMTGEWLKITIWRETARWRGLMKLLDRKSLLLEHQSYEVIG